MELGSNRVWDYTGDNYVHRLVQNKTDGKLVEVDEHNNVIHEEKIDALNLEYTYLLTTQLESQRLYFEEKLQSIERQSQRQVEELETKVKKAIDEMVKLEQQLACGAKDRKLMSEEMTKLEQQFQAVNKDKQKLSVKLAKVMSELVEEKELNSCLRDNQTKWQQRVNDLEDKLARKDIELTDLRDQLRDVMFFLEAKDTLAATSGATQQEIQEGQIIVQSSPGEASGGSASAKKSRTKKR
jgi:BRCA1-associated protein